MEDETEVKRIVMTPNVGKGKQLCDMLRAELNIPAGATEFEVHFAVGEPISVRCTYLPRTV